MNTVNTIPTATGSRHNHTAPRDGVYNVTIDRVKAEPDPKTAGPVLVWWLSIEDRPYKGTRVSFLTPCGTGSVGRLKEVFTAIGTYEAGMAIVTSDDDENLVIEPRLAGLRLRAVIKDGKATALRGPDGQVLTSVYGQRYDAEELMHLDALWNQFEQTAQTWTGTHWWVYALGYRVHLPEYAAAVTPEEYFARLAKRGATATVCNEERERYFSAVTSLAEHSLWRSDGLGNARIVYDIVLDAPIYVFQSPDTGQMLVVTPEQHPGLDQIARRSVDAIGVSVRRR